MFYHQQSYPLVA